MEVVPSYDFDGGDREVFEECDAKPDGSFLLRVEIMMAKTKIRKNGKPICLFRTLYLNKLPACQESLLKLVTKK
jgi:hypothetical protein